MDFKQKSGKKRSIDCGQIGLFAEDNILVSYRKVWQSQAQHSPAHSPFFKTKLLLLIEFENTDIW